MTLREVYCHASGIFRFSFLLILFFSSLKTIRKGHLCVIGTLEELQRFTQDYWTTELLVVIAIPVQHVIPILPHQIIIIHQPLDESRRTKYGVFKLQHPIPLATQIEEILDTKCKDWIDDESRTRLLWDRDMDGMRTWANPKYEQHVDHAPQSSAPTR